jgi:CreA protein
MKTKEKIGIGVLCIIVLIILLLATIVDVQAQPKAVLIGEVECIKRMVQGNDVIRIIRVQDPDNPFISIFFTTIKSGKMMAMADPSNTSIAARLTGEIPTDENGERIINTTNQDNIASVSKSIGSKVMKIARFYDKKMDTFTYLVYTTKLLDGSLKHSLSVVPLGKPLVQQ